VVEEDPAGVRWWVWLRFRACWSLSRPSRPAIGEHPSGVRWERLGMRGGQVRGTKIAEPILVARIGVGDDRGPGLPATAMPSLFESKAGTRPSRYESEAGSRRFEPTHSRESPSVLRRNLA